MTVDDFDARALLQVAPDDYVAERTRLVKKARADGARAHVKFYQSLKRPNLSLWAVLAAGADGDAVGELMNTTSELATIQAGGSGARVLAAATQHRRKALDSLVDGAVTALARWECGADTRRLEIRGIIDQLSRHPDVASTWIDATLRDLPDDAWGFGAFADMQVTAAPNSETPRPVVQRGRAVQVSNPETDSAPRPTRAVRAATAREARQEMAIAKRDLVAAERRVEAARQALRAAEKEARLAEADHGAAEQRHQKAAARLESNESP